MLAENLEHDPGPIATEGYLAEIGERPLRRSDARLALAQLVRKADEERAVAAALKGREHEDAREVLLDGRLLLAEVAHDVCVSRVVLLREDVKEERVDVKEERLVIEEELGAQAEVLAVQMRRLVRAVHLVHRERRKPWAMRMTVNLLTRRLAHRAFRLVFHARAALAHVLQAKLANEQLFLRAVLVRIGRPVPRVDVVLAHLNHLNVLHLGPLLVLLLQKAIVRRELLRGHDVVHFVVAPLHRSRHLAPV
mmetsp:Transcript_14205/g.46640  ORF Transcript_14205/g.46640 Transcript_14205/m.46640 type:complete len:251 (-) Transcript_14205:416-1168(-)